MRRSILTLLLLLLVGAVAVGFYRGWFAVSNDSPAAGNKTNINLTVDPDKMKEDAETVKEKTAELVGQGTQPANER